MLGVKLLEGKNKETRAKSTAKVKELLTDTLHIDPTELNNEIDKVYRLLLTNKEKETEETSSTPNIICNFKSMKVAIEKNLSPRKMSYTIIATRTSNFMSF